LEKARLIREEKELAVQRLARIEAYNKEQVLKKMEDDNRKMRELQERKAKIERQKLELNMQQAVMKRALTHALDAMKRTHKWVPPEGVDIEIDMHRLMKQAQILNKCPPPQ